MNRTLKGIGIALLVAVLGFGTAVSSAATKANVACLHAGAITGTVTDSAGKALAGISLKLTSDGKVIAQIATDKEGKYALPELAVGKYELAVAGAPVMKLVATADAEATTLKIVLPQRDGYAALTGAEWGFVAGGVIVVGVATPVIVNNASDGGGGHGVSP